MAFKRSGVRLPLAPPLPSFRQPQDVQKLPENRHFGAPGVLERSHAVPYYPHIDVGMNVGLEKWQS